MQPLPSLEAVRAPEEELPPRQLPVEKKGEFLPISSLSAHNHLTDLSLILSSSCLHSCLVVDPPLPQEAIPQEELPRPQVPVEQEESK